LKKIILFALTTLLVAGCADDDDNNDVVDNVQEAAEDRDLQDKNFVSACSVTPIDAVLTGIMTGGGSAIKSMRVQYRFEGNDVTRTTFLFSEPDCTSDVAIQFREVGDFDINPDNKSADGGKFIDIDYHTLHAQVLSQAGVDVANSITFCGASDWVAGAAERVVSGAAADLTCYSAQIPRHNSNIYRIDADVLYLGPQTKANNDGSSRPTALDMNVKYTVE
jgi:hypothetical protein